MSLFRDAAERRAYDRWWAYYTRMLMASFPTDEELAHERQLWFSYARLIDLGRESRRVDDA